MSQSLNVKDSTIVIFDNRLHFFIDAVEAAANDKSHFARSASPYLIPFVAVNEALEAIEAYSNEPKLAYKAVEPAFSRLKFSLRTTVARHFADSGVFTDLVAYGKELTSRGKNKDDGALSAYLRINSSDIKRSAEEARKVCIDSDAYATELGNYISDIISDVNRGNNSAYKLLDRSAKELIAFIVAQGRTPASFLSRLQSFWSGSEDLTMKLSEFKKCVLESPSTFQVAVVIDGTAQTRGLYSHDFFTVLHNKQISWLLTENRASLPPVANSDLARFCYKHWRLDGVTEPSDSIKMNSQVLLVKVKAWDHEQARHEALDKAEAIVDLINAEHRAMGFGVKRKVAVWQEGTRDVVQLTSNSVQVPFTRLLNISRSPSVDRSLRFATRAATERAGSMQTFFSWIALEYLGRGGTRTPQNTISAAVPDLVSLVAVKQLIIEAWHELTYASGPEDLPPSVLDSIRRPEERSKKAPNPHLFDKNMFAHLLISDGEHVKEFASIARITPEQATRAITDFISYKATLSQFSQHKLRQIRDMMRTPTKLVEYMVDVQSTADRTMQRMRFVRNQTAHTASSTSTEHMALSKASLMILDSVFESVTRIKGKPVDALAKIRDQRSQFLTVMKKHSSKYLLPYNPNKNLLI
ncbi:hypothetical protein [Glutamicibacter mysorens]|uniref:hypothetical protein n=1 Tax=Glutamicibacter mysorens TaxID=257984 RepID=UPI0020C6F69E|nr:hypothetical protein [Glutamicibacter mysorens]UTM46055.1 hypothetical protein XH9_10810 [Glutamicibacter mysorens]